MEDLRPTTDEKRKQRKQGLTQNETSSPSFPLPAARAIKVGLPIMGALCKRESGSRDCLTEKLLRIT